MLPFSAEIVVNLLETLNEKDEKIRSTIDASLHRIAKKRYDEIIEVFCDYRAKHAKLSDNQVVIILKYVEPFFPL
jgi:hypothetical protein